MPTFTNWYLVIVVREGSKHREVRGPSSADEAATKEELDIVRAAMKAGEWVDLPWFSARADVIDAAYIDSTSVGFA